MTTYSNGRSWATPGQAAGGRFRSRLGEHEGDDAEVWRPSSEELAHEVHGRKRLTRTVQCGQTLGASHRRSGWPMRHERAQAGRRGAGRPPIQRETNRPRD